MRRLKSYKDGIAHELFFDVGTLSTQEYDYLIGVHIIGENGDSAIQYIGIPTGVPANMKFMRNVNPYTANQWIRKVYDDPFLKDFVTDFVITKISAKAVNENIPLLWADLNYSGDPKDYSFGTVQPLFIVEGDRARLLNNVGDKIPTASGILFIPVDNSFEITAITRLLPLHQAKVNNPDGTPKYYTFPTVLPSYDVTGDSLLHVQIDNTSDNPVQNFLVNDAQHPIYVNDEGGGSDPNDPLYVEITNSVTGPKPEKPRPDPSLKEITVVLQKIHAVLDQHSKIISDLCDKSNLDSPLYSVPPSYSVPLERKKGILARFKAILHTLL